MPCSGAQGLRGSLNGIEAMSRDGIMALEGKGAASPWTLKQSRRRPLFTWQILNTSGSSPQICQLSSISASMLFTQRSAVLTRTFANSGLSHRMRHIFPTLADFGSTVSLARRLASLIDFGCSSSSWSCSSRNLSRGNSVMLSFPIAHECSCNPAMHCLSPPGCQRPYIGRQGGSSSHPSKGAR